jgi:hypothetical protein
MHGFPGQEVDVEVVHFGQAWQAIESRAPRVVNLATGRLGYDFAAAPDFG